MTTDAALKSSTTRHAFGVDWLAAITALRELADAIEDRTALPQEIVTTETVTIDDFAMTTLSVKYAPRNPDYAPERIRSMENVTATWDAAPAPIPTEGWELLASGVARYHPPLTYAPVAAPLVAYDGPTIGNLTGWTIADPADVAKSVTLAEAFGMAAATVDRVSIPRTMDDASIANLHRVFPIQTAAERNHLDSLAAMPTEGETVH